MSQIDLNKYGSVANYVKAHMHPDSEMHLLDPLPAPIVQHGQTCKLYALSVVMAWMYQKYPDILPAPPPARKCDRPAGNGMELFGGRSLRKQAKQDFGSKVGEIYDYRTLLELAKRNGFANGRALNCTREEYVTNIKNEIDKGNAPVIFFDVSADGRGMPIKVNSNREHAAVIAGYFTRSRNQKLYFILLQWGEYYVVNANKLAASANQLNIDREPEYFYKKGRHWHEGGFLAVTLRGLMMKTAKATGPESTEGNFRNKIIILDAPGPAPKPKI